MVSWWTKSCNKPWVQKYLHTTDLSRRNPYQVECPAEYTSSSGVVYRMQVSIPNYPAYFATPYGDIVRFGYQTRVKPRVRGFHTYVKLVDAVGCNSRIAVHRIIAQLYLDNPEGHEGIIHEDGDKTNNCVDNLRWASIFEIGAKR